MFCHGSKHEYKIEKFVFGKKKLGLITKNRGGIRPHRDICERTV